MPEREVISDPNRFLYRNYDEDRMMRSILVDHARKLEDKLMEKLARQQRAIFERLSEARA